MTTVGVVGGISVDHIVHAPVGARFNQPGGPGLYASLAAALVRGVRVVLVSELPPEDTCAVRQLLRNAEIDTGRCTDTAEAPRLWILQAAEGRRIVPTYNLPGDPEILTASAPAQPSRPPIAGALGGLDAVLLCAPPMCNDLTTLGDATLLGVDPDQIALHEYGWSYISAYASRAHVLLPSRSQLGQLGNDPLEVADLIRHRFTINVVAKLDRDGAVAFGATGGAWRIVDPSPCVIDTTGAGDALAGATVAALAQGHDLPRAVAIGVTAARLALSDWSVWGLCSRAARSLTEPDPQIHISAEGAWP